MSPINLQSVRENEKILVVDDTIDNLFLLQMVLEAEGYRVDVVDSGWGALKKIEESVPDLVLLDVMMPEMNGYEVARTIRQNQALRSLPILMITGCDRAVDINGFPVEIETEGFIRKPVDLDELLVRVRTALARKRTKKMNCQLVG